MEGGAPHPAGQWRRENASEWVQTRTLSLDLSVTLRNALTPGLPPKVPLPRHIPPLYCTHLPPSTPEGKGRLLAGRMNGQGDAVARKLKHDERRLLRQGVQRRRSPGW